jgi:MoxR-like ATPase
MTESTTVTLQEATQRAAQHVDSMKQEIGKALVGQASVIEEVLIALLAAVTC